MRIELLAQTGVGGLTHTRTGDVLNAAIGDARHNRFKFAVAYMRLSGLNRLSASIGALTGRGGTVSGAVGIDDGITTVEALDALAAVSTTSTVFYTVSGFIYHPKLYLAAGTDHARIVLGSPNLTRDGLYRNIEAATSIELDLSLPDDRAALAQYEASIDAFLNLTNPNVVQVSPAATANLATLGLVRNEAQSRDLGPSSGVGGGLHAGAISGMFPPITVPTAPPNTNPPVAPTPPTGGGTAPAVPAAAAIATQFLMEMSAFDASHQPGTSGTHEILITVDAVGFFPVVGPRGRQYEDVFF